MHVTVLVGIQLFQVFPGHPAPLGRPEELSTQAQLQVGTGCCLVIPNHRGRDVCLGSTVWPRWGLPGQLSCPQIPPWGQGPRARRHGCERRRGRPGDGPVHRAALASHAQPALRSEGSGQKTEQGPGTGHCARHLCVVPLETCTLGTGPHPRETEPTQVRGRVTRKAERGMLSLSMAPRPLAVGQRPGR